MPAQEVAKRFRAPTPQGGAPHGGENVATNKKKDGPGKDKSDDDAGSGDVDLSKMMNQSMVPVQTTVTGAMDKIVPLDLADTMTGGTAAQKHAVARQQLGLPSWYK